MAQYSGIEWTDHTFNPWWGCIKVSPGCVNCYAETWANRYGHDIWGKTKRRRLFGKDHWNQPLVWNRKAIQEDQRYRVFCASMADVFEDNPQLDGEREKLWELIEATPQLDWLLLTKRPENMNQMTPWELWPQNIWAMTSVENQKEAEIRIPILVDIPASVIALSVEPLLDRVDLSSWIDQIDWVIVGGESGNKARPMHIDWVREIRDLCIETNTAFFFKQWGEWLQSRPEESDASVFYSKDEVDNICYVKSVGKKQAGRTLDGDTWDQLPQARRELQFA